VLLIGCRLELLAGAVVGWRRLGLMLAELVVYLGVYLAVVRAVKSQPQAQPQAEQPPPPAPEPEQHLPDYIYLNQRRVNDSITILRRTLIQQETVTIGTTTEGGVEVRGDLVGVGLGVDARRTKAQQVTQTSVVEPLERYLKLHDDILEIREIPDDSPATLKRRTFWDFPLVGVEHVSADAEALYAVGLLDHLQRPVWFRLDTEWQREKDSSAFRGDLMVVAQGVEEGLPDHLVPLLPPGMDRPAWRLRPLAVHR
jgi:hypothetical protein